MDREMLMRSGKEGNQGANLISGFAMLVRVRRFISDVFLHYRLS